MRGSFSSEHSAWRGRKILTQVLCEELIVTSFERTEMAGGLGSGVAEVSGKMKRVAVEGAIGIEGDLEILQGVNGEIGGCSFC
ncbi:hypothetical protein NL676_016370 [Syzygium grande]|nr:hypothetical protein NL676_016370 [Syzygium grande]